MEVVCQLGEVRAVDDLPARTFGQREAVGQFGVGQHDDVVPALPFECRSRVTLDVVTQGVAGFASLADGIDVYVLAAANLTPTDAVVPDLAALDLEADNACTLDGDDEVDLVILE